MPTVYDDDAKICPKCGAWNDLDYTKCKKCETPFDLPATRKVSTEWGMVERKVVPKDPDKEN